MVNEDTGEEIRCPHCGSVDECLHLLAVIDRTFNYCPSGYASQRFEEFRDRLEIAFRDRLRTKRSGSPRWSNSELGELWENAKFLDADADIDDLLDPYVLTRLIIRLLGEAGGEQYPGPIDDGGGPGYSSAITLFHAQAPEVVFEAALSEIKQQLAD